MNHHQIKLNRLGPRPGGPLLPGDPTPQGEVFRRRAPVVAPLPADVEPPAIPPSLGRSAEAEDFNPHPAA
jgi:hypothetical protein